MNSITIRKDWHTRTVQGDEVIESRNGQRPQLTIVRNALGEDEVAISVPGLMGERVLHLDSAEVLYDLLYVVGTAIAEMEHCEKLGCRVVDGFRIQLPDNTKETRRWPQQ